jgi:A/G-specific adenine glycosylase
LPVRSRSQFENLDPFVHVLTHKDLHLHPVVAQLTKNSMKGKQGAWFAKDEWTALGLPAPIRRLLEVLQ